MIEILIDAFWLWSTQLVQIVPVVIGLRIVFQWIADLLFVRA